VQGCGARNNGKLSGLQSRDLRDHFFGQAVTEVVVFALAAEVAKGQDCELDFVAGPLWRAAETPGPDCWRVLNQPVSSARYA